MLIENLKLSSDKFKNNYLKTKLRMVLVAFVLLGAINWVFISMGFNIIGNIKNVINQTLKINLPIDKIIYIIIGLSAVIIGSTRETWLPFLGTSLLPDSLIPIKVPPSSDRVITINTTPNTKIAYWASSSKKDKDDVINAYGDYLNSGVVISDSNGKAQLPIQTGNRYVVPSGRIIDRHIHYREVGLEWGLMSKVKTINY